MTPRRQGRPDNALYRGVRYSAPLRRLWSAAQPFVETPKRSDSQGCQREGKNKRLDHLYLVKKFRDWNRGEYRDDGRQTGRWNGYSVWLAQGWILGRPELGSLSCVVYDLPAPGIGHHSEISSLVRLHRSGAVPSCLTRLETPAMRSARLTRSAVRPLRSGDRSRQLPADLQSCRG